MHFTAKANREVHFRIIQVYLGDPVTPQSQTVADYKHTAESHCSRSQHWIEQSQGRGRDEHGIVEESPEQVLLDRPQRPAG
jgi:hypothetical protein